MRTKCDGMRSIAGDCAAVIPTIITSIINVCGREKEDCVCVCVCLCPRDRLIEAMCGTITSIRTDTTHRFDYMRIETKSKKMDTANECDSRQRRRHRGCVWHASAMRHQCEWVVVVRRSRTMSMCLRFDVYLSLEISGCCCCCCCCGYRLSVTTAAALESIVFFVICLLCVSGPGTLLPIVCCCGCCCCYCCIAVSMCVCVYTLHMPTVHTHTLTLIFHFIFCAASLSLSSLLCICHLCCFVALVHPQSIGAYCEPPSRSILFSHIFRVCFARLLCRSN